MTKQNLKNKSKEEIDFDDEEIQEDDIDYETNE